MTRLFTDYGRAVPFCAQVYFVEGCLMKGVKPKTISVISAHKDIMMAQPGAHSPEDFVLMASVLCTLQEHHLYSNV